LDKPKALHGFVRGLKRIRKLAQENSIAA